MIQKKELTLNEKQRGVNEGFKSGMHGSYVSKWAWLYGDKD